MTSSRLAIVGVGGHGLVVADAVLASGKHDLVGFVAKTPGVSREVEALAPWLGSDDDLIGLVEKHGVDAIAIAIGANHSRRVVMERLRKELPSYMNFPPVVHPTATVGFCVNVGAGAVILSGAVVGPGSQIGEGCLVNTRASLDHHGALGDYASLAPGVTTGGNVRVGEGSAVSIGAIVLHGRSVGAWSVVGAGALVVDDVPDGVVAYGTPARVVRERAPDDRYL
jgi:sugar O-acyltransferase (sialic acid O-acetyltransferase NeuD family)